jgi:hypothetical protein
MSAAFEPAPLFAAPRQIDNRIMQLLILLGTPAPENRAQVAVFFASLRRPVPGEPNFLEMMTLRQIRQSNLELDSMLMALIESNASRCLVHRRIVDTLESRLRAIPPEPSLEQQEMVQNIGRQVEQLHENASTSNAAFRAEQGRIYMLKNIIRDRVLNLGARGQHPELAEMQAILGMINNEVMPGYTIVDPAQRRGAAATEAEVTVEEEAEEEDAETKRICANCKTPKGEGCRLRKCGGCMRVRYCSAACQNAQWQEHKVLCASVSRGAE